LSGVVDGKRTKEERIAAIAASEKPFGEVFDLTDSSRLNDLRCSLDVICPDVDPAIAKRVRKAIEKKGGVTDVDEIVKAEAKAAAAEQAALDELTMKGRPVFTADGTFSHYERAVDAKAEGRDKRPWRIMPFGRYKGRTFESIPRPYLCHILREGNVRGDLRYAIMKAVGQA